jgi:hypothetical protein
MSLPACLAASVEDLARAGAGPNANCNIMPPGLCLFMDVLLSLSWMRSMYRARCTNRAQQALDLAKLAAGGGAARKRLAMQCSWSPARSPVQKLKAARKAPRQ